MRCSLDVRHRGLERREVVAFRTLPRLGDGRFERFPDRVGKRADKGTIGGGERTDPAEERAQLPLATQDVRIDRVELRGRGRTGDRAEGAVAQVIQP